MYASASKPGTEKALDHTINATISPGLFFLTMMLQTLQLQAARSTRPIPGKPDASVVVRKTRISPISETSMPIALGTLILSRKSSADRMMVKNALSCRRTDDRPADRPADMAIFTTPHNPSPKIFP
jgi:hypothetical protein